MSAPMRSEPPVFVALTQAGADLARTLAAGIEGAEVHGLARRVEGADQAFEGVGAHFREVYRAGRPIVGLCAAGILIRALAPVLGDKATEPSVIALAEDGSAVVPLLGGHRGANDLAEALAERLGIAAAVTTAGDRRFGLALDSPPPGWVLGNPRYYKDFTAELLSGSEVRIEGEARWLRESALPISEAAPLAIRITHESQEGAQRELVYHPACLAVGVGCERGCDPDELIALVRETLAEHGLAVGAVAALVSIDLKADEPAVHAAAEDLAVPARFFDVASLAAEEPRLATPSDLVRREVGVAGVAESAALAAAGSDGQLLVPKTKSRRATCAVALAPAPIVPAMIGRPRGRLAVVGLGPGGADWRTPEVERELKRASDLVGYRCYLDLAGPLAEGKAVHAYDLGEEEARVCRALNLAAEGRQVALVCSGDPGIYAMASPVFELIERDGRADWNRVEVVVAPGLSALQAAAARIGAPLGHDFCAISLSDLMTPWPAIERRLAAAGAGDFVVALYNPVSERRRRQLARAVEILREHRPADTPVVLARNLGRPGEAVTVIDLQDLTPERVDMLTLVLVGSSETRRVTAGERLWVYTPRGYGSRDEKPKEAQG
ncbi:MAG: precorrin-3B C(17)-methyltransferase [Kiloniellales bacterium]|nr:precorrin-3B C(17)-methyltransferase [Kiloniellales bacterium]